MSAFQGESFEILTTNDDTFNEALSKDVESTGEATATVKLPGMSLSPIVVIVIGMAGTGKTTLMHRINLYMIENKLRGTFFLRFSL